jgi:hypothetical protein
MDAFLQRWVGGATNARICKSSHGRKTTQTVNDEQQLVCHCPRKSRVFRAFGRALLAGHGLRRTWFRAVQNLLEMNVFSRQAGAHGPVNYRLSNNVLIVVPAARAVKWPPGKGSELLFCNYQLSITVSSDCGYPPSRVGWSEPRCILPGGVEIVAAKTVYSCDCSARSPRTDWLRRHGTKFESMAVNAVENIVCPACSAVLDVGDQFCRHCGTPTSLRHASGAHLAVGGPVRENPLDSPWVVLGLLLFVLGPFALPLLYKSRAFNVPVKMALTVAVLLIAVVAVWVTLYLIGQAVDQFTPIWEDMRVSF